MRPAVPRARLADAFLGALLTQDRWAALRVAREALEGHPGGGGGGLPSLYDEVVAPAMRQVGELWHEDRVSVADEHAASAIAQATVAALYPELSRPAVGAPLALVCCVEGERHELGARMVADVVALDGWSVVFLGADTPTPALLAMVDRLRPVFVALSVTLPLALPTARDAVRALRAASPARVLLGGGAVARLAHAATKLGADAVGTCASSAVDLARAWKPGASALRP